MSFKPKTLNINGFSLIELMVVIAIISLLVSFAIPNLAILRIKAARAEMLQNQNAIYTLAHSFHAESGYYYPPDSVTSAFGYGYSTEDEHGGAGVACGESNHLGFAAANCERLYYFYTYNSTGADGNSTDLSRQTYFTISAISSHVYGGPARNQTHLGRVPPTGRCKRPSGVDLYFQDRWTKFESGHTQPFGNLADFDALKNCFD